MSRFPFLQEESGTTAVEYAIMLALILMACIVAVASFGSGSGALWTNILDEIVRYLGGP